MAAFKADDIANLDATTAQVDLRNRVAGPKLDARTRKVKFTYTMVGTEAANDTVKLCRIHKGETLVPHESQLTSDGIATTATVHVGDDDVAGVGAAADDDRYCASANVAAANTRPLFSATGNPAAAVAYYEAGAECWLIAKFATMATPVAGKKLRGIATFIGA